MLPESYDKLAGLELGGVPLATVISLKTKKPCLFVRKTAKNYGTRNLVEGSFTKGDHAVVVEDVITTAGQVCRSVRQMREFGLEIKHVVCVLDRQQGGGENVAELGPSLVDTSDSQSQSTSATQ